jgi:signal transduction histidine kinase
MPHSILIAGDVRSSVSLVGVLVSLVAGTVCPAQSLRFEPVANSVDARSFTVADLNGDGADDIVAIIDNHAYVYAWDGSELVLLSQISFDRSKTLGLGGAADLDGLAGEEFALTQLDPDTLTIVTYALHGESVAPQARFVVTRGSVGGIHDSRGPFPWDAEARLVGGFAAPGSERARVAVLAFNAGYSQQPRGLIAFDCDPPHAVLWQRLIGPCVELGCRAVEGGDAAASRIVMAGSGYCNGAQGSGIPDSIAAVMVVDGTGAMRWWRQVGSAHTRVCQAVADVDGDGKLEVIVGVRHQEKLAGKPATLRVLALEDGRILRERDMEAHVVALEAADLDRDHRAEILALCEDGTLRIFDESLDLIGRLPARPNMPALLLVEDLTGDDRPEIVVRSTVGVGLEIYNGRLRPIGALEIGGLPLHAADVMRTSSRARLLVAQVPDELRLFRVERERGSAFPMNLFTPGRDGRGSVPLGALLLAIVALGAIAIILARRLLRGSAAHDRLRSLVSDLKIIRHGVRAQGEKPEPLVRLRRGLRTCAEPGGLEAGLRILRDAEPTYRAYVQPTLRCIRHAALLVLPGRLAVSLWMAHGRSSRDLDRVFARLANAERDAAPFAALCVRAEALVSALEARLQRVETAALRRVQADPLLEANAACDALRLLMKQRAVEFGGIEVTGEPGARAFIEGAELRRVLHDLLLNAIEACQEVERPRVQVAIACGERRLLVRMTDNGRGVSPEDAEAIFHGKSTKTPPGGTGLAHARRIVESYSGKVLLRESTPWENTVFEVELCRVPS